MKTILITVAILTSFTTALLASGFDFGGGGGPTVGPSSNVGITGGSVTGVITHTGAVYTEGPTGIKTSFANLSTAKVAAPNNIHISGVITSNTLTIPATTQVFIEPGGLINAGASTVTIGNLIDPGMRQIFGTGTFTGMKMVRPDFWGVTGDGVVDDVGAFQKAVDSLMLTGGTMLVGIPAVAYKWTTPLQLIKTDTSIKYDNITIKGAGGRLSHIIAGDPNMLQLLLASSSSATKLKNFTVDGLFFDLNGAPGGVGDYGGTVLAGISVENADSPKIINNTIIKAKCSAILVARYMIDNAKNSTYALIENNILDTNYADGIYCQQTEGFKIINNMVLNNGSGTQHYPILVEGSHRDIIAGNIVQNSQQGISVDNHNADYGLTNTTITGNTILNSLAYGISSIGSSGLTIANNTIKFTAQPSIIIYRRSDSHTPLNTFNTITGNNIFGSEWSGISVADNNNIITNNSITNCNYSGAATTELDKAAIALGLGASYNTITGNRAYNVASNERGQENGLTKYVVYLDDGTTREVGGQWAPCGYNEVYDNPVSAVTAASFTALVHDGGTTNIIRAGNLAGSWAAPSAAIGTTTPVAVNTTTLTAAGTVMTTGPVAVTSFTGTVSTSGSSTTITFTSAADAILAGYSATNPILGVTLIAGGFTRYVTGWTNSTTCVVNTVVTLAASTAITSVKLPIKLSKQSDGTVAEVILANGNRGIGMPSPQARLDIRSPSSGPEIITADAIIGGNGYYQGIFGDVPIGNDMSIATHYSGAIVFGKTTSAVTPTWGTEWMRISNGGNVGIGTTVPVSTAHISKSPVASANYGTLSLGGGVFDGAASGHFVGSSAGTSIAVDEVSGYAGDLLNLEVAGVSVFGVSASSHVNINGTAPALTTCGTSPTIATGSNDRAGTFTMGATGAGCTVTFATAYTSTPSCVVNAETAANMTLYTLSNTAITVVGTPGIFHYNCEGLVR